MNYLNFVNFAISAHNENVEIFFPLWTFNEQIMVETIEKFYKIKNQIQSIIDC